MKINKKIIYILLISCLVYGILSNLFNYKSFASTRTQDLTGLDNSKYKNVLPLIQELQKNHPNWTFTILYTGLNWDSVIDNETIGERSLVQNSNLAWIRDTTPQDNGSWYCASEATVSYYMDIRNWINEKYIFAFETLSYDENTQKIEGVNKILKGTFMDKPNIEYKDTEGNTQIINKSYAQIIMEAANESSTSPYHLASRIKQEQGKGTSPLISGVCEYKDNEGKPLKGYYNYFNIGAMGNGNEMIIKNGLKYAKSHDWISPEAAIKGGAKAIASRYISVGQNTLYLQKYDVADDENSYGHQYMQNVSAPYSEGRGVQKAYKELGMLDSSFNFVIPVYENMPDIISPIPSEVKMNMTTENVKVTTQDNPLNIRETPSGDIIGSIPKNEVALRIEKATDKSSDGNIWDKVVYNTGTEIKIGYCARKFLTDIPDVVTTNEAKVTNTEVNLRNGPGTFETKIKQTLKKDVKVTVIDKITYMIDGYYWHRIKLADGTQGYIASQYLSDKEQETLKYKIEGQKIIIAPGTKIEEIEGATTNSEVLGTGAKITIGEGENKKEYTLIILGDINGDGKIKASDYMRIKNKIMEDSNMNEIEKKAADINGDTKISASDYVYIKNYIMEISPILIPV